MIIQSPYDIEMAVKESKEITKFKKEDSGGYTFYVGQCVLKSGELIDFAPEFIHLPSILDNLDQLQCRENDVWLTSYSKAGTHWTYEILAMLQRGDGKSADNYKGTYMLETAGSIDALNKRTSPRILNTHMRPKYLPQEVLTKNKIVHVVRNPKSIAVSYYHHTRRLEYYDYEGTFHTYLPTYMAGYHKLYGNWFDYVQEWWDVGKGRENVYFIFYEDMKMNPVTEIQKLSRFLGFKHDTSIIERIANLSSFDTMKSSVGSKPGSLHGQNASITFRKGTIDDWKNHFTCAENETFDKVFMEHMQNYTDLADKIKF